MHHKELELADLESIRQFVEVMNPIKQDNVNKPKHYSHNRKGIECIQAIEASMTKSQYIGWLKGQVIKYVWRFEYKHEPLEDLQKAEFYLKRMIKELDNDQRNQNTEA